MNNLETMIAVYSRASALVNTIKSEQKKQDASSSMSLGYLFRESSADTEGLSDVDAIIYDLSLVKGDVARAATEILHLKVECGNKPLILIGSRQALEAALASPRIKPEVAHTVAKPMNSSQLRLVSEAVIIKHRLSQLPAKTRFSAWASVGASVAVVVALAVCLSAVWMSSTNSSGDEENSVRVERLMQPITGLDEQRAASEGEATDALAKLASLAVHQKRLAFPIKDNALYYFDQILELDSRHLGAYQGRQKTLRALDSLLAMFMSDENFVEAEKLLEVLLEAEPHNAQYRRIDLAIRNQKYAPYQPNITRMPETSGDAKASRG